jgi:hypothetical protein
MRNIALDPTDFRLFGHVKESMGSHKPEYDEWVGGVSDTSCADIKNMCAAGFTKLILKDDYSE